MNEHEIPPRLERYCRIARPVMLRFMPVNSCIAATKLTCLALQALGFRPQPLATKMVFAVPGREVAFCTGLSDAERATAKGQRKIWGEGWNGHLIVRVNKHWLLDATLDQAGKAIPGLFVPSEVFLFPLPDNAPREFHVTYGLKLDGERATLEYVTTGDKSYCETDAWTDEGLHLLAMQLVGLVKKDD